MKNLFKSLQNFLVSHRRSGTTSLIRKITEEHDCIVIVKNLSELGSIRATRVSLGQLYEDTRQLDGLDKKPILIDNSALLELVSIAKCKEEKLAELEKVISEFKLRVDTIDRYFNGY